jgi:tRNA-dihydrouridine synthase B
LNSTEHTSRFDALLAEPDPVLALAPMQDVTDLPFWRLMTEYGGADLYYTEYFRVHRDSHLEKFILESLTKNPTGRPAIAQMIGNDIPSLVRAARELQQYPVTAIDLNLGCPAPVVYRKCAGGGLLREPDRIDSILGALRDAVSIRFTVKTRVGFDDPAVFEKLIPIFARHSLDLLTVHGRTVADMYRGGIRYNLIAQAAAALPCPVLANGNVGSAAKGLETLKLTGARGLMIGRGAIANPWIFNQIRQLRRGEPVREASGPEILDYIRRLYDAVCSSDVSERCQVQKMKKTMNFVAERAETTGQFLHEIRRVSDKATFFEVCERHLLGKTSGEAVAERPDQAQSELSGAKDLHTTPNVR